VGGNLRGKQEDGSGTLTQREPIMKFISSVEQDISRVSEANEWDILLSTRNKFHISKHPCNILFISETFTKKV
jgi:hypothetical protein